MLLHGRASLGKSPITWQMALSVASGKPLFGLPVKQGPVLYIEVDSPEIIVKPRLKLLHDDFPGELPLRFAFFDGGFDILQPTPKVLEQLNELASFNPALVIINTLRKVFSTSANDSETPSRVYREFRRLFPGSALLFVHHDRKLQKDHTPEMESEDLSGSLAWLNDCNVGLHLVRHGKEPGSIRLDHTKSQASERLAPLLLKLHEDGSHIGVMTHETLREVAMLLKTAPPSTAREKDLFVAGIMRCSERSARRYRLQLERLSAGATLETPPQVLPN